jgi:hypothetical protein
MEWMYLLGGKPVSTWMYLLGDKSVVIGVDVFATYVYKYQSLQSLRRVWVGLGNCEARIVNVGEDVFQARAMVTDLRVVGHRPPSKVIGSVALASVAGGSGGSAGGNAGGAVDLPGADGGVGGAGIAGSASRSARSREGTKSAGGMVGGAAADVFTSGNQAGTKSSTGSSQHSSGRSLGGRRGHWSKLKLRVRGF